MKRIMGIFLLLLTLFSIYEVKAANYGMRELIPNNIKTTIRGKNLLYKDIEYNDGKIVIGELKNLSNEKKSITISIGISGYNGESYKDAIDAADRALYIAKECGRNCVKYVN